MKKLLVMIGAALCVALSMTAVADLPSGYRQLDYVDTDGQTWVNTLFEPTCTNAVEIKASVADPSTVQFLYCSRHTTGSTSGVMPYRRYHSLFVESGKARFDYSTWYDATSTLIASKTYVFAASPEEKSGQEEVEEASKRWLLKCYIDNELVKTSADRVFWVPLDSDSKHQYFCLFGSYDSGDLNDSTPVANFAVCRFHYFKVWDTKDRGSLLCHIVPAYGEAEQSVGLYDLVAGRFLPAHGGTLAGMYTLAEDEVWPAADAMAGEIDLNGHNLTAGTVAKNRSSSIAGAAYQDLGYIAATGSQKIEIPGFRLPGTARVEMKFRPTANVAGVTEFLFYSRSGQTENTYTCCMTETGYLRFDFNNRQTIGNKVALEIGEDSTLAFEGATAKPTWSVNGTTEKAHDATSNDFTGGSDLILFGNSLAGTISCRLYYFTVTTNGVTALDLRPVRRLSDGVAGLYDTVGGAFYTSGTSTALPGLATPKFTNSCETVSELHVGREVIPGYTLVDRISTASSSSGPYIDTGFVPAATDRIEIKASQLYTYDRGLFCSRTAEMENTFSVVSSKNSGLRYDFNTTQYQSKIKPTNDGTPFTVALDGNAGACYYNGEAIDMGSTLFDNNFTPAANLYIFAMHKNGGDIAAKSIGSIYRFKVTGADGTPKLDMVPVVRDSDGKAGLYDLIRRRFHPSSSETGFTAGSTVGDGVVYADVDGAFDATEIADGVTLVKNGESAFDGGGTTLDGALKVNAGTVGGVTLQNGAKLDISDASAPFSLDDNAISFADGATIYVDVGSRKTRASTPVVSWTAAPPNIGGLRFIATGDGGEHRLHVQDDGLYYNDGFVIVIH